MAGEHRRAGDPDEEPSNIEIMKACVVLTASAEIALEQLYVLEGTGSKFYKQKLKNTLNAAKKAIEPFLTEMLNWNDAEKENKEAENEYYKVVRVVETFSKILSNTPGEKLLDLKLVMEKVEKGEYVINSPSKETEDEDN